MKQTFRSLLIVSIFVFGVGYLYAWTGPTAPAPDKNVAAPLNVGENEQIKKGNLILGGDSLSGNGLAKLQVTGASLLNGKVTITANTTDNPALVGKVFTLMDGNEGAGKVLTSDNNGVATWKEIATTSRKLDISLSSHAPYYGNFCTLEDQKLQNSERHLFESARTTSLCGGNITVFHPGIYQILVALRDEPQEFIKRLKKIKYTKETFESCLNKKEFDDYLNHALNEFVLRRMSRGGLKKSFAWSDRMRGGQPGDVNAWTTILEELPKLSIELKSAFIMNEKALKVIDIFNDENTFLYIDPPYTQETRASHDTYEFDMTTDDHIKLADKLNYFKGKVILSGYASKLYKRLFNSEKGAKWRVERKMIANHSSQAKSKEYKIEQLWLNF
ncbi:MAG: DNA adenine methylase [bacterium]